MRLARSSSTVIGVDLGAAENPMEMAMAAEAAAAEPKAAPAPKVKLAPKAEAAPVPVEAPAAEAAPAAAEEESEYLRVTREYDADVDAAIVTKIEKHLGASLSNKDSKYVACSDETELRKWASTIKMRPWKKSKLFVQQ